jgi:hypothetical protein
VCDRRRRRHSESDGSSYYGSEGGREWKPGPPPGTGPQDWRVMRRQGWSPLQGLPIQGHSSFQGMPPIQGGPPIQAQLPLQGLLQNRGLLPGQGPPQANRPLPMQSPPQLQSPPQGGQPASPFGPLPIRGRPGLGNRRRFLPSPGIQPLAMPGGQQFPAPGPLLVSQNMGSGRQLPSNSGAKAQPTIQSAMQGLQSYPTPTGGASIRAPSQSTSQQHKSFPNAPPTQQSSQSYGSQQVGPAPSVAGISQASKYQSQSKSQQVGPASGVAAFSQASKYQSQSQSKSQHHNSQQLVSSPNHASIPKASNSKAQYRNTQNLAPSLNAASIPQPSYPKSQSSFQHPKSQQVKSGSASKSHLPSGTQYSSMKSGATTKAVKTHDYKIGQMERTIIEGQVHGVSLGGGGKSEKHG